MFLDEGCEEAGLRSAGGALIMGSFGSVATTSAKVRMVGRQFVSRGIRLGAVRVSANICAHAENEISRKR
jgi:hypothetical protein